MTDGLRWLEVEAKGRRIPKWALRAALDLDGTVFVPAVIAGSEAKVFWCAGYDGVRSVVSWKHAYFPADWMAREFPNTKDTVEKIERRVREHFA